MWFFRNDPVFKQCCSVLLEKEPGCAWRRAKPPEGWREELEEVYSPGRS